MSMDVYMCKCVSVCVCLHESAHEGKCVFAIFVYCIAPVGNFSHGYFELRSLRKASTGKVAPTRFYFIRVATSSIYTGWPSEILRAMPGLFERIYISLQFTKTQSTSPNTKKTRDDSETVFAVNVFVLNAYHG